MPINITDNLDTLSALNIMASYIGIPPLGNIVDVPTHPDFVLAQLVLDESTRSTLSQGLPCNVDFDFPLTAVNSSGEVIVPEGALICDVVSSGFVERDGVIYDLRNQENVTQLNLKADIVWNWSFDDLPTLVQSFIVVLASRAFVARIKGDEASLSLTIPDERRVKQEFQRYVFSMGDVSLLDGELPYAIARAGRNFNTINTRF